MANQTPARGPNCLSIEAEGILEAIEPEDTTNDTHETLQAFWRYLRDMGDYDIYLLAHYADRSQRELSKLLCTSVKKVRELLVELREWASAFQRNVLCVG